VEESWGHNRSSLGLNLSRGGLPLYEFLTFSLAPDASENLKLERSVE